MGCTGSKLVAAEPNSPKKEFAGDVPRSRIKQARLSIAGNYSQFENMNGESSSEPNGVSSVLEHPHSSGLRVHYAHLTQRGHYPDQPAKANQDAVMVIESFAGVKTQHLMGVLDGHGETGAECALFSKATFAKILMSDPGLKSSPNRAIHDAMIATNAALHTAYIDDTLSGTTACVALLQGDQLYVANVGDSRAVLATRMPSPSISPRITPTLIPQQAPPLVREEEELVAVDLTTDQTPFREDECERVRKAGARVMTLDQVEGLKDPEIKCWTNESSCDGDPPRLWAPAGTYPGTAFTRSIGDSGRYWQWPGRPMVFFDFAHSEQQIIISYENKFGISVF